MSVVYCRKLTESDAESYRDLRLSALASSDNRFLIGNLTEEASLPLAAWKNVCAEVVEPTGRSVYAVFGAFWGNQLVGASISEMYKQDQTGQTAYYRSLYVSKNHRNKHIGELIARHEHDWAVSNGYSKSVCLIRQENKRWLDKQPQHGARIIDTLTELFANGEMASVCVLERPLVRPSFAPA